MNEKFQSKSQWKPVFYYFLSFIVRLRVENPSIVDHDDGYNGCQYSRHELKLFLWTCVNQAYGCDELRWGRFTWAYCGHWNDVPKLRQSKTFVHEFRPKRTREFFSLTKKHVRWVVNIFTGHRKLI